jgi:hypothetical protein
MNQPLTALHRIFLDVGILFMNDGFCDKMTAIAITLDDDDPLGVLVPKIDRSMAVFSDVPGVPLG